MALLTRLLQNVDDYYQQATEAYGLVRKAQEQWTMPDDPEEENGEENPPHFDELMDISRRVDDPGLGQQLQILAELYKRSIQIGGGYATIARAINNLKNMYSDGKDSDIEFILNGMIAEMAKHAGGVASLAGQDNAKFVQQLQALKQEIELRDQDRQSEAIEAYQEGMNVPGAVGESAEDFSESGLGAEEGEVVFDPTAGLGGDRDGPAVNRGWHTTGKAGLHKDWTAYYNNEREAYEADLAQEKNPDTVNVLKQLINLLHQLAPQTEAALKLSDDLRVAPDPAGKARLDAMRVEMGKLKKSRTLLKNKIRSTELQKEKQKLQTELAQTTEPKAKELLRQRLALNELSLSTDKNKAKERNLRVHLIESMSGGNFPSQALLDAETQKIEEAKKLRVTLSDYLKNIAKGLKEKKEKGDFAGLVIRLKQHVPNIKMGDKKEFLNKEADRLINQASAAEKTSFKPYIDNVAAARTSRNKVAEKKALSDLYNALAAIAGQFEQLRTQGDELERKYADVTAWRKQLEMVSKSNIFAKEDVSDGEMNEMKAVLRSGLNILKNSSVMGLRTSTTTLLREILVVLDNFVQYHSAKRMRAPEEEPAQKVRVESIDPETGEITYEEMNEQETANLPPNKKVLRGHMNKKERKLAFEQLKKQALLDTSAEAEVNLIMNDSALNSIQDPNEYAHQVFQRMLASLSDKMKGSI